MKEIQLVLGDSIIETYTNAVLGMTHQEPITFTANGLRTIIYPEGYAGVNIRNPTVISPPRTYRAFYVESSNHRILEKVHRAMHNQENHNFANQLLDWINTNVETWDGMRYVSVEGLRNAISTITNP